MSLQIVVLSVVLIRSCIFFFLGGGGAAHLGSPSGKAMDWGSVFCPPPNFCTKIYSKLCRFLL